MCNSDKIKAIRNKFKNSLITLDCVSGSPCIPFNPNDVDTFYFSVQKCFGFLKKNFLALRAGKNRRYLKARGI